MDPQAERQHSSAPQRQLRGFAKGNLMFESEVEPAASTARRVPDARRTPSREEHAVDAEFHVIQLQGTAGNRAVSGLIASLQRQHLAIRPGSHVGDLAGPKDNIREDVLAVQDELAAIWSMPPATYGPQHDLVAGLPPQATVPVGDLAPTIAAIAENEKPIMAPPIVKKLIGADVNDAVGAGSSRSDDVVQVMNVMHRHWMLTNDQFDRTYRALRDAGLDPGDGSAARVSDEQLPDLMAGLSRVKKGAAIRKASKAVSTQEWVKGQWSTPDFKGEQEASVTQITKKQLFEEIARVAPSLPRSLKACLVGHAWVEQQGKGILNYNFAGVEGGSAAYVMGWTSDVIPTSTYENEPDKSKNRDWDSKGHNPKFGKWNGHDAGTIAVQLDMSPKPTEIVVLVRKRRPAYQSLTHAAASFVKLIEKRVEALRVSTNADHNKLGEMAFAGDPDAYANIVNHSFRITDRNGKKRDFGAYNGDKGYAGLVKRSIAEALTELP